MGSIPAALPSTLVVLGVALRVWAYVGNRSFWLDEILLTRNIVAPPMGALLREPLRLDQVAPRGFLLLERLAVLGLGDNELALRLVPFLSGVAALLLFRRLADRLLDAPAATLALGLFAIGIPLLRYAGEVKQYGLDAAATVLLLLLALSLDEPARSTRWAAVVGLIGFGLGWLSQTSVIVMAGIGVAFAGRWLGSRDRRIGRALLVTMPMWAVGSFLAVVAGLRSMTPSTREFMHEFWGEGFVPLPFGAVAGLRWLLGQGMSVFTDPSLLRYGWPALYAGLSAVGVVALWRRRGHSALLLLAPLGVAVVAAAAHQYPFRGRLLCYLLPILLLAIAAGAEWLGRQAGRIHPGLAVAAMLAVVAPPLRALVASPPPYEIEHHRTVYAYLERQRRPGDAVYVFPLSRVGALFYGPRFGLEPSEWTTAVCDRDDTRAYVRDVDRYRGVPRLWVISAGARPYRAARAAVRGYLGTIGVRRDSLTMASLTFDQVGVELYDLSDRGRLAAASAETFAVPPMPADPRPGCRPWARPSPLDRLLLTGASR